MSRLGMAAMTLMLAACTPMPSADEAMKRLNQRYDGQPLEAFTQSYGEPAHTQPSGHDTVYRWVSIESSLPAPEQSFSATVSPHGQFEFTETTLRSEAPDYCEILIRVDGCNIVRHLSLLHDSVGEYSSSLCAEIFNDSSDTPSPF